MNRYEKIKSMSIEDMAKFFSERLECYQCSASLKECSTLNARSCDEIIKDWLSQEVENE